MLTVISISLDEEYLEEPEPEPEPERTEMSLSQLLNRHHDDAEGDEYYGEEYEEEDY